MKMEKCGEKHDITLFLLGSADSTLDNPQYSAAWYNKGRALYKLNKSDEAITAYDKAIIINPQDSDAWENKGTTLAKLGKFYEAIKAYDKAIEIDPQHSNAWYNK